MDDAASSQRLCLLNAFYQHTTDTGKARRKERLLALTSLFSKALPRRCPISASRGVSAMVSATTRNSSLTIAFCSSPCDIASPLHKACTHACALLHLIHFQCQPAEPELCNSPAQPQTSDIVEQLCWPFILKPQRLQEVHQIISYTGRSVKCTLGARAI